MSTVTPPTAGAADRVLATRAQATRPSAGYWTGFVIVVALLAASPLVLPEFWQRFTTEILIWGLLAMSSDLLIGYTGVVSFGHSAFFGLGMYGAAAALLIVKPPNLWLAILVGLVASAVAQKPSRFIHRIIQRFRRLILQNFCGLRRGRSARNVLSVDGRARGKRTARVRAHNICFRIQPRSFQLCHQFVLILSKTPPRMEIHIEPADKRLIGQA